MGRPFLTMEGLENHICVQYNKHIIKISYTISLVKQTFLKFGFLAP